MNIVLARNNIFLRRNTTKCIGKKDKFKYIRLLLRILIYLNIFSIKYIELCCWAIFINLQEAALAQVDI